MVKTWPFLAPCTVLEQTVGSVFFSYMKLQVLCAKIKNWVTNLMLECFSVNDLNRIDLNLSAYNFLCIFDLQITPLGVFKHMLWKKKPYIFWKHLWNSGHSAWARNLSVCCIECGKIVLPMFDAFQICKNTLAMEPLRYYVSFCKGVGVSHKKTFLYNLCTTFLSSL